MIGPNSRAWWLTPLVAMAVSFCLGSDGQAQSRRSSTNWVPTRKVPEQTAGSKPAGDATMDDELADDDSIKDKEKPGTRAGTKKKKSTGSKKSDSGKPSSRQSAGRVTSELTRTATVGPGGFASET
jgi:hypothetical protein